MKVTEKKHALALYDERKAAEVAAFFLLRARHSQATISKLRLAKWMYLAERFAYERFGEPMVGDRMLSMEHGPVLSNTLFLMERPEQAPVREGYWEANIATVLHRRRGYMELKDESAYESVNDLRRLSESDIDVLEDVWRQYGRLSANELENRLHNPELFPEWTWKRGERNSQIDPVRLLPILGWSEDDTAVAISRLEQLKGIEQAFDRVEG